MKRMGLHALTLAALVVGSPSAMAWHICGTVYCDANGNSIQDSEDTPLAGVTVRVVGVNGAAFNEAAVTGPDGVYCVRLLDVDASYCASLEDIPNNAPVVGGNSYCFDGIDGWLTKDWLVDAAACRSSCWMTAGGVKFEPLVNEDLAEAKFEKGPNDSFGGNVYPGCSAFAGDGGHWNHVSHRLGLHLNGQDQHVIECGNVPGTEPGTDSPVCTVNYIHWEGWGTVSPVNGRDADKKVPVYYEAKVEDRAEPGNLKGAKNQPDDVDRYFIKVWYANPDGSKGAEVPGFEFGSFDAPILVTGGNLQIHCTSCD